jgi:hypothetical protein
MPLIALVLSLVVVGRRRDSVVVVVVVVVVSIATVLARGSV